MRTSKPAVRWWVGIALGLVIHLDTASTKAPWPAVAAARAAPARASRPRPRAVLRAGGGTWADAQLRARAQVLRSHGATARGVGALLGLTALAPRLPAGHLAAFLQRGTRLRLPHLVRDVLRWLDLQVARDLGQTTRAQALRRDLGLMTQHWWLLGPFDNEGGAGFARRGPAELAAGEPLATQATYPGKGAPVRWRPVPPVFPDGRLRIGDLQEAAEATVSLIRTDLVSQRPTVAALRLGTRGSYRVYLNGTLVAERTVRRAAHFDQDAVGLRLRRGRNALLLVLATETGPPEAIVRLSAAAGGPLRDVQDAAPAQAPRGAHGRRGDGVRIFGPRPKPVGGPKVATLRALLEAELRRHPKDPDLLSTLVRFHLEVSPDDPRDERALGLARALLALRPTAESQRLVARSQSQPDARRLALQAALRVDPRDVLALDALGDHYFGADQQRRAEAFWRRARAADPGYLPARLKLAELFLVRRLPSAALRRLRALARTYPQRDDVQLSLASVEQQLGLRRAALGRLRAILPRHQVDLGLLHRLVTLEQQTLQVAAAQQTLRAILRAQPTYLRAAVDLADSLAANGAPQAGLRVVREAQTRAPHLHALEVALARIALRAGLRSVARRALTRALEIRPQDLARKRLLSYLERQGPDPLVRRHAVDAQALARAAWKAPAGKDDATVLRHTVAYDVLESGLARRFEQQVVLIHNRKGVAAWATSQLDYLPDTQQLEVRVARVIRPDGSEVEASQADVPLGDPSIRMYYDRRLKVIRFRGLQPGDVIELQTLLADIPASNQFKDYFGAILPLQGNAPIAHLQVEVSLPARRRLFFNRPRLAHLRATITPEGARRRYRWEARDVPAVEQEPGAPGWAETHAYLHLSTFGTWPEVARWYWGLVREQFHADEALRRAAHEATRTARTIRAKVLAIYHLVTTKTRYVALAFGMHTYKPYSAAQVFARKFGDCKDKAMLMAVLLREVGVTAYPALLRTRRGGHLAAVPPSLAVFDHAILFVPALSLWLDGTAERTGAAELPWADQGVRALIIDGRDGRLVRTPVLPATESHSERRLELTLQPDGSAVVTDRLTVRGQEAPWWRRRFTDPQTRRQTFEQLISQVFPRAQVSAVTVSDPDAFEQPVTLLARYRVPGFARVSGARITVDLRLADAPLTQQFAPLSTRTQPLITGSPRGQTTTVTVRWPATWHVASAPRSVAFQALGPAGTAPLQATQQVTLAADRLTLRRTLWIRRHRFAVRDYAALRRFWVQVDEAHREPLELTRRGGAK